MSEEKKIARQPPKKEKSKKKAEPKRKAFQLGVAEHARLAELADRYVKVHTGPGDVDANSLGRYAMAKGIAMVEAELEDREAELHEDAAAAGVDGGSCVADPRDFMP